MRDLYTKIFLSLTLLIIGTGSICNASIISVYVDYKPLNVGYVIILDEVFVPADALIKALKENDIKWDSSSLWITVKGKEVPMKGITLEEKVLLPLKAIAKELGYVIEWDEAKSMLNVDTTRKVESPQSQEAQTATRTRKRRNITITLFQEVPITNMLEQITALRVFADVKNEKIRPVENIEAHCVFRYPGGDVYFDDAVQIEKLTPGESKRVVFYTTNPLNEGKLEYELTVQLKKK